MTPVLRALVVGASGFVGSYLRAALARRGHEVWGTYHANPAPGLVPLDISDGRAVGALVARLGPEVVFIPAAVPNVDWCETHPVESFRVNVAGLANLLRAGRVCRARPVFFSTEYVFDGTAGPYSETDRPAPLSVYGRQKLAGERMVLAGPPGGLVLRTTVVYGWEARPRNFGQRLLSELREGRRVRVPEDQISSPTYVVDLAEAACRLAERGSSGLYHVAGCQRASRLEFARALAETFGLDGSLLVPVSTAELGQRAARPLKAGLRVDKVGCELGWVPAGFRDGLARMREERAS